MEDYKAKGSLAFLWRNTMKIELMPLKTVVKVRNWRRVRISEELWHEFYRVMKVPFKSEAVKAFTLRFIKRYLKGIGLYGWLICDAPKEYLDVFRLLSEIKDGRSKTARNIFKILSNEDLDTVLKELKPYIVASTLKPLEE